MTILPAKPPPMLAMPAPRVLVADDNPLSLAFFAQALEDAGCVVTLAADGAEAVALARNAAFDLLLLDARMPKLDGAEALAAIRAASGSSTRALATTATNDRSIQAALLAAGFAEVLHKPLAIAALRAALARHLPELCRTPTTLDDAQALSAAGGNPAIVSALRGLLATELDALPDEIAGFAKARNAQALYERLHRLDASAGFCGAPGLVAAGSRLRDALADDAWPESAFADFLRDCTHVRGCLGNG